jgi:hypothetical protein
MSNFTLVKVLTLEGTFFKKITNVSSFCMKEQVIINKVWNLADIYTIFLVMISRLLVL